MKNKSYDSDFCGNVPIHLINLVQPYGVLIVAARADLKIIQVSENVEQLWGRTSASVTGSPLTALLGEDDARRLEENSKGTGVEKIPLTWQIGSREYLALLHTKSDYLLIEVSLEHYERNAAHSFVSVYQDVKRSMMAVEAAHSTREVCGIAAAELKKLSGFDKVMIYHFDKEWNGSVWAEEMEKGMESYYGFTFPASDIPQQARNMYLKNSFRYIPDRDYKPVGLYPVINPSTQTFIDLSDCNLRAVPAVHIEYLKNMNVESSMSTRIIVDGKLWGLIACHHRTPREMSYQLCSMFELMSDVISGRINTLLNKEEHGFRTGLQQGYTQLVEEVYKLDDLKQPIISAPGLHLMLRADGIVFAQDDKIVAAGLTPSEPEIEELLLWLHTKSLKKVYYTESLAAEHDRAQDYASTASGLLVIPMNVSRGEYILLFRAETIHTINWGGNPEDRIRFEKDEKTYHPRHSFKLWQEHVKERSLPWKDEEVRIAESLRSFIYEYTTVQ